MTSKFHTKTVKIADDNDSVASFASGPHPAARTVKYVWSGNDKIDNENFHRMVDEYRDAKKKEKDLELKAKQLAAQLARTEEAAKRALVRTDATAKGGAAQKLLDAETALQKLREENAELHSKLARERKRSQDFRTTLEDTKKRLDGALREQRNLVKKVGELERQHASRSRRAEDHFWSEEAGRRFVVQQEELVNLKDENQKLLIKLKEEGKEEEFNKYEKKITDLQNLVKLYEKKIAQIAESGLEPGVLEMPDGPGEEDWVLEDFYHENQLYLLDRKNGKLFSVPGENQYPRPLGVKTVSEVRLGSANKMDRFLNTLDELLQSSKQRIQDVFNDFDLDGSGYLDRRELSKLVQTLLPDVNPLEIEEIRTVIDVDGDGQISLDELLEGIKEAYAARSAAKVGKTLEVNNALDRVRDALRENRKLVREAFNEMDSDKDGCLTNLDMLKLVKQFVKDLVQRETRYLLAKLQEWDVAGEGKLSLPELYQALGLQTVHRLGQGGRLVGAASRSNSPRKSRAISPSRASAVGKPSGGVLKEAFLKERVAQLEAEIRAAHEREGVLEVDAKQVDILRRDLARHKSRIEELEQDFMNINVLQGVTGDEGLQRAWETAATFKKRFLEHKAELDNIRITYARMQAQLDETHKMLHEEHKKKFKLEDQNTALQVEVMRLKDFEDRLGKERQARVKLEREFLAVQQKAFDAPGGAMEETRALRDDVFRLRREKALAEQKENNVRRELALLREELDGMQLQTYHAMQADYQNLKKRCASLEIALQAAEDKLAVYRRTELPKGSILEEGADGSLLDFNRKPDADKSEEELRIELAQLREVWQLDQAEIKKLHKVLEMESLQTLEAKAGIEDALRELDRLKKELADEVRKGQRALDQRDEKIRKLELQLRGAYSGINRALRSNLRDSRLTDDPDDVSELGEGQNILELHVAEASLLEDQLGHDPSTFFTFDFFMHDTQATPVLAGTTPNFNTLIQYVLEPDPFLIEYLDTHSLALEFHLAKGWEYETIGIARISLRQVLEDLEIGAALGHNRAYHYVDIFGAAGQKLGRVRYGFSLRRPLDALLNEYRLTRARRPAAPDSRDPATLAVQTAQNQPQKAAHVKVIVFRVDALQALGPGTPRPYVHYRFPGHSEHRDTLVLEGTSALFNEEAVWAIARTPELEHNFRTREMEFVVFDELGGDDPTRSILGVAHVPLADLAQGIPVEGVFQLVNPISRRPGGRVTLGIGWHNPMQMPNSTSEPRPKLPLPDPTSVSMHHEPSLGGGMAPGVNPYGQAPRPSGPHPSSFGLGAELRPTQAAGSTPARPPGGFGIGAEIQHNHPAGPIAGQARPGFGLGAEMHPSGPYPNQGREGFGLGAELHPPGPSSGVGRAGFGLGAELRPTGPSAGTGREGFGLGAELHPSNDQGRGGYGLGSELHPTGPNAGAVRPGFGLGSELHPGGPNAGVVRPGFGLGAELHPTGPNPGQIRPGYGLGAELRPAGPNPGQVRPGFGLGSQLQGAPAGQPYLAVHPSQPPGYGAGQRPGQPVLQGAMQSPYAQQQRTIPGDQRSGYGGDDFGLGSELGGNPQRPGPAAGRAGPSPGRGSDLDYGLFSDMAGEVSSSPPGGMVMLGGSGGRAQPGEGPAGRPRYPTGVETSLDISPRAQPERVLMRVGPDPKGWPSLEHAVVLRLESLTLSRDALQDTEVSHIFFNHEFLNTFAEMADQCTLPPIAKRSGPIPLNYTVAYVVGGGGQHAAEAGQQLAAAAGGVLSLLLVSTHDPQYDFSRGAGGSLQRVGFAEVSLEDIWAGRTGDMASATINLIPGDDMYGRYPSRSAGTLTFSLYASRALANLAQNSRWR